MKFKKKESEIKIFDVINSAKKKNICKCHLLKDQMKYIRKSFPILPPEFLNIWTLVSWEWLPIEIRFCYKKWSHLNALSISIISFENCQPSNFFTEDNDVSCHVTSRDFEKRPQGEKWSLTCQCSISSKKTKVTRFARLCRIMTCLLHIDQSVECEYFSSNFNFIIRF